MGTERELVLRIKAKDCEWQYFRAGGPGGQNQNKRDTAARCIHHPSGARGESREAREREENRRRAFRRMAESPRFRIWARTTALKLPPIDVLVNDLMSEANLVVEVKDERGRWVEPEKVD